MSAALFWTSLGLVAYVYAVFPALLLLRARFRPRPYRGGEITPRLTMIIAAHNEEADIAAKLNNALALDYPPGTLEVIVASDGSDDRTEAIVRRYERCAVRLLPLARRGKAAAVNAAAAAATGEVLVFSDANSLFAPDALRALVRPLADPRVGGVAGDQRHRHASADAFAGESRYWSFERKIKQWESAAGNTISATGGIYALRRELFRPLPPAVTDDFVASTAVIAQGYRLVFAPDAIAWEPAIEREFEFGRKVRIATRGLRGVIVRRALLDPRHHGFYSLQLFTHKVLRRLMAYPLLVLLAASALCWPKGGVYAAALAAQGAAWACAGLGLMLADTRLGRCKGLALARYFCLVNLAGLWASLLLVSGRRIDRWEPQRHGATRGGTGRKRWPCCA